MGWIYILLSIFLGLAATNTGNNLIYLIDAALLSFMGVSGYFGRANLASMEININIPDEVYALRAFPLLVQIKSKRKFFPTFLLRVKISDTEVLFPYIDANSFVERYAAFTFKKRGVNKIDRVFVCSVFPFNFFVRCKKVRANIETIVFPEPKTFDLKISDKSRRLYRGDINSNTIGFEGDLMSVRNYIEGDPFKYVNWKLSAKTDQLKTKEFSALLSEPVLIDFDKIDVKDTELKISYITYVVLQMFKKNQPVGFKIGDILFKPETSVSNKLRILKELSLLK
ncbi:protein of unknown function DUF58 [Candidatus Magnetoovum chiemensis]|nr:protein of unknown function DUF58 [Candidatus Magnetoovum chiemensis]